MPFFVSFGKSLLFCCVKHVVLYHDCVYMPVVCKSIFFVHRHILQPFACFPEPRSRGVFFYVAVLQIVEPFFKRCCGHFVELVHTYDEIFREDFFRCFHAYGVALLAVHHESVCRMHSPERGPAVIEIVSSLSEVEIKDVY